MILQLRQIFLTEAETLISLSFNPSPTTGAEHAPKLGAKHNLDLTATRRICYDLVADHTQLLKLAFFNNDSYCCDIM